MFPKSFLALSGLLALVAARPASDVLTRGINAASCSNPVAGLNQADCQALSKIGVSAQGKNDHASNGLAWIGTDGPNTFQYYNDAGVPLTVVLWNLPAGDYQAICMNVRQPLITASVDAGKSITVSVANGVSGAFAGLYNHVTTLSQFGGINNVWGEFTTGNSATVDVSREVNMAGNHMSIKVAKGNQPGCVTEWTPTSSRCVFQCTDGTNSCEQNYALENCANGSQPGAQSGTYGGKASGGCSGWNNGGHLDVHFLN